MEVSTGFPLTSELWDITMEWSNMTTDWDMNDTTEIYTTEKPVIKPPETPPINGTRFAMAILMSMIMPLSIFGNSIVLAVIIKTRSLQRPNTMMYISLSASDFMRTIFCMPFFTYALYTNDWEIPEELCPFYHALYIMVRFVSVLNLTVISIERYIIITHPLLYHRKATKTRMLQLIGVIWTISLVYGSLNILWFFDLDTYISPDIENKVVNIPCRFEPDLGFVIFDFILTFIIPLTIMFSVYVQIFLVVRSQMKKIQPQIHKRNNGREPTFYERPSSGVINNSIQPYKTTNNKITSEISSDCNSNVICTGKIDHIDMDIINTEQNHHMEHQQSHEHKKAQNSSKNKTGCINHNNPVIITEDMSDTIETLSNGTDTNVNFNEKDTLSPSHITEYKSMRLNTNNNKSYQADEEDDDICSLKSGHSVKFADHKDNSNNYYKTNLHQQRKSVDFSESKTKYYRKNSNSKSYIKHYYNNRHNGSKVSLESTSQTNISNHVQSRPRGDTFEDVNPNHVPSKKQGHNKAVKLSIGVIGTFVLCFAPVEISFLIETACTTCVGDIAWMIVNTLAFLSSAVNPFVYSLYSTEFRTALKKLVVCQRDSF